MNRVFPIVFWFTTVVFAASCGGALSSRVPFERGAMPPGGSFDGVYSSDFGRMELTVDDSRVVGLYEADHGEHKGRIEGHVKGDLLLFTWTQWNADMQGKWRESTGRGVFKFKSSEVLVGETTKAETRLEGVWGYGDSQTGNNWDAYKLTRSKKRLRPFDPNNDGSENVMDLNSSAGFDAVKSAQEPEQDPGASQSDPEPESEPGDDQGSPDIDELF